MQTASTYILAMSCELERRRITNNTQDISKLSPGDQKRALELSIYFTIPQMEPRHRNLAVFAAMNFAHRNKQNQTALKLAERLLKSNPAPKQRDSVSLYTVVVIDR